MRKLLSIFLISGAVFSQENPDVVISNDQELIRNSCWATLYEGKKLSGSNMTIFNGYDLPDLEFSAGPVVREKIQSIETGTTAQVSLYPEENFRGREYIIHPSGQVKELPWDEIRSLRLTCVSLEEALEQKNTVD